MRAPIITPAVRRVLPLAAAMALLPVLAACTPAAPQADDPPAESGSAESSPVVTILDKTGEASGESEDVPDKEAKPAAKDKGKPKGEPKKPSKRASSASADELRAQLDITEDYRESFVHGDKPASCQKYIVLHDTEGEADGLSTVSWWDSNGAGVAAHFVVNRDGSIVQCVPLDKITHHAGFGDTGHNQQFGVEDESRDDMVGTVPIGDWAADYGMNSYSIGIEMVHVGGSGEYPAAQLEALDGLIAYIDAYYGFESQITDHKAWRSGNSDTSPEFAEHLESYKRNRVHAGA